ncbi:TPA: hypothetical protein I8W54_002874 [Morganella morganii]|uniref:hypothetical protein n=1 Tax=Enterobacterales TaxID=91347 RepID=UPI001A1A7C65|nr:MULTISPECIES: hypothetical protein [Enterobacterales]MCU6211025.1 hypothetical protein [Morganella morganii]HAT1514516.1 hypothetical protein [Morganella morganii]
MKITPIFFAIMSISPLLSYANNIDLGKNNSSSSCGAYVKSVKVDNSSYRFRLVDSSGKNINGSNDWSFTARDGFLADMLNKAYLMKSDVCVNYTYYSNEWKITNVKI